LGGSGLGKGNKNERGNLHQPLVLFKGKRRELNLAGADGEKTITVEKRKKNSTSASVRGRRGTGRQRGETVAGRGGRKGENVQVHEE